MDNMCLELCGGKMDGILHKKPSGFRSFLKKIGAAIQKLIKINTWEKDTKRFFCIIIVAAVLIGIMSIFLPGEAELASQMSDVMTGKLAEDEKNGTKTVAKTYNSLLFVNYLCYSTSGNAALSESYIGFMGHVYDATADSYRYMQKSVDGERIAYVTDKLGEVVYSEEFGDKITYIDGVITANGNEVKAKSKSFAAIVGELVNYTYRMLGCGQSVLYGAKLTIFLTISCVICGFILSIFLALGKISKLKILSKLCSVYIFFFRGTPLMIQIFVIYFALPGVIDGFTWTGLFSGTDATSKGAFLAAFIAFSLNTAAYCAEIVRAAIQSIDKGQSEAAHALGMSYAQTMSYIIIPQSVRRLIPPIANEFIMILKDASLVFVISLQDITTISKVISSKGSFLVFVPALAIYLVITWFFSFIFNKVEKKFSVYE